MSRRIAELYGVTGRKPEPPELQRLEERRVFCPAGHVYMEVDYANLELRVLAQLMNGNDPYHR